MYLIRGRDTPVCSTRRSSHWKLGRWWSKSTMRKKFRKRLEVVRRLTLAVVVGGRMLFDLIDERVLSSSALGAYFFFLSKAVRVLFLSVARQRARGEVKKGRASAAGALPRRRASSTTTTTKRRSQTKKGAAKKVEQRPKIKNTSKKKLVFSLFFSLSGMASSFLAGAPDEASCMRYEIYAIRKRDDGDDESTRGEEEMMVVEDGDDVNASSALLAAARSHVATASSSTAADYLWYRDSLLSSLRVSTEEEAPWRRKGIKKKSLQASTSTADDAPTSTPSSSSSLPPCLWGELDFGDAIDDEWAAAWMLLKATSESFRVVGESASFRLAARCWDDDGDFLLIEAAEALPRWLSPSSSENRCWLFGGRVHIVLRKWKEGRGQQQQQPTLAEALEALARGGRSPSSPSPSFSSPSPASPSPTFSDAGPKIHAALSKRLGDPSKPPAALRRPLHAARALVPARLAALVSKEPSLVSAAVDLFYRRGPRGIRAASRTSWFPPPTIGAAAGAGAGAATTALPTTTTTGVREEDGSSSSSLVPLLVRTTRLQFAQLALQQYLPPRGWPSLPQGHGDAVAVELGAKLAAGFEILMATRTTSLDPTAAASAVTADGGESLKNSSRSSAPFPSDPHSLDALDPPGWKDFLNALEARGAFVGEIRGSARHQELRRQAAAAFLAKKNASSFSSSSPLSPPLSPAREEEDDSSPSPSSAAASAALRAASILKELREVFDFGAMRAAGDASVAAVGESSLSWLQAAAASSSSGAAAASSSSPGQTGIGGYSDEEDGFAAAIAEAEARQASEAERKLRKKKGVKKKEGSGGEKGAAAAAAPMSDDNDDDEEEKEQGDNDFDPASVVERVKSFVEKMSSWEGAEAAAAAAPATAAAVKNDAAEEEEEETLFAGDRGGVTLDESAFWEELGAALGPPLGGPGGLGPTGGILPDEDDDDGGGGSSSSEDEGSSFYSEGEGSDDGGNGGDGGDGGDEGDPSRLPRKLIEAEAARLRALEASGSRARRGAPPPPEQQEQEEEEESARGGGSRFAFPASSAAAAAAAAAAAKPKKEGAAADDDDDDFAFATAYEAELERQLRGTTLGQTWGRDGGGGGTGEAEEEEQLGEGLPPPSRAAKRATTTASAVGGSSGIACLDSSSAADSPLVPVDVDVNLIESLLASYAGEAGVPGPASTLAGMLGVSLPLAAAAAAAAAPRPSAAAASLPSPPAPPTPSTSEKEQNGSR